MSESSNIYKTDYLDHESAFCLSPGLFRSCPKGGGNTRLEVDHVTGGLKFEFRGPYLLTPGELRVLQGLIAIAPFSNDAENGWLGLYPDTENPIGIEHRRTMDFLGTTREKPVVVTRTSFFELAREIGYGPNSFDSGKQIGTLRRSIERLWMTSVIVEDLATGKRDGSRLVSQYQSDKKGFTVALNFRIASIALGVTKRYTRISMSEIRALKTDPARLMHQRLCAWIDQGKTGSIELDTLCGYVWFETAISVNTIRRRRQIVRNALKEFVALGWEVCEHVTDKFAITRRSEPN